MALTDDEREMLEQLEAQLANDDPSFVQALASDDDAPRPDVAQSVSISPRHLVLGLVVAVIGLIVVLGGVAVEIVPIGIVGALIVFAGFWYLAAGFGRRPVDMAKRESGGRKKSSDFMERQAQAWQKRRDERGF